MKSKKTLGLLVAGFMLTAQTALGSVCGDIVLRTYQKNSSPTDNFYPAGESHLTLEPGLRYGLFVQHVSRSQNPYLLEASVRLSGRTNALSVLRENDDVGSITVDTNRDGGGSATFTFDIKGRYDGKPLNIDSRCKSGSFSVEVRAKGFDVAAADSLIVDVLNSTESLRRQVAIESANSDDHYRISWQIREVVNQANRLRSVVVSSRGEADLVKSDLSLLSTDVLTLQRMVDAAGLSYRAHDMAQALVDEVRELRILILNTDGDLVIRQ